MYKHAKTKKGWTRWRKGKTPAEYWTLNSKWRPWKEQQVYHLRRPAVAILNARPLQLLVLTCNRQGAGVLLYNNSCPSCIICSKQNSICGIFLYRPRIEKAWRFLCNGRLVQFVPHGTRSVVLSCTDLESTKRGCFVVMAVWFSRTILFSRKWSIIVFLRFTLVWDFGIPQKTVFCLQNNGNTVFVNIELRAYAPGIPDADVASGDRSEGVKTFTRRWRRNIGRRYEQNREIFRSPHFDKVFFRKRRNSPLQRAQTLNYVWWNITMSSTLVNIFLWLPPCIANCIVNNVAGNALQDDRSSTNFVTKM